MSHGHGCSVRSGKECVGVSELRAVGAKQPPLDTTANESMTVPRIPPSHHLFYTPFSDSLPSFQTPENDDQLSLQPDGATRYTLPQYFSSVFIGTGIS